MMESSYSEQLQSVQFGADEIGVVLNATSTILRRHNIDGALCPHCGNDDRRALRVTKVDEMGFITQVSYMHNISFASPSLPMRIQTVIVNCSIKQNGLPIKVHKNKI